MQQSQGKRYYANQTAEIDRHIGKRIKISRRAAGLTQMKLAEKLGMTFQQIQKYETGGNRIPASRLFDLSQALETSVAFFFSGLPGNFPPETKAIRSARVSEQKENDPLAKNESLQLINLYWNLPTAWGGTAPPFRRRSC